MSQELANKSRYILEKRATFFQTVRDFFQQRSVLEVDTPALVKAPPIDDHIDCFSVNDGFAYLHTSPEYCLKRLIASGAVEDCYSLGHVFRAGELGFKHNPEFTMLEWYRLGFSLQDLIEEAAELLKLFFGPLPLQVLTYRQAFEKYAKINYSEDDLSKLCPYNWSYEDKLDYILTEHVEPNLGQGQITAIIDYPADQAALATTKVSGNETVANRFELYYQGVELANGYNELSDAEETQRRFDRINEKRIEENKPPYKLDKPFLTALKNLPPCSGVALGFDRALMLSLSEEAIEHVLPFPWNAL